MLFHSDKPNAIFLEIYDLDPLQQENIRKLEEPYGLKLEEIDVNGIMTAIWIQQTENIPPEFKLIPSGNFIPTQKWNSTRHSE